MRLKGFLVVLLSLFCTYSSFAQSKGELTQSRILILLDESSSMIQKWPSGKEKYKAADELILHLMDSIYAINDQVEFSLRVFGHQYTVEQNNCYDTKSEVPFSKDNRTQMALRLDDIHPLGVTPIAFSLMQAAQYDLVDEAHNAYSIILITDGGESCGGDICEVMKKLMKYKVYFKPYIVSLEDDPTLKITYSCMGDYLQITKDADMPKAVSTIVNAFRPVIRITKTDYKQLQSLAANVPSALKVNIPVIIPPEPEIKKKPEETPVAKPVKTFIDSTTTPIVKEKPVPKETDTVVTVKPATKIKVEEARVKPALEDISRLATTKHNLLYSPVPASKTLKTATVPDVEIIIVPAPENVATATPAELKQFNTKIAPQSPVNSVDAPEIEISVKPEADKITAVTPVHLKLVNYLLPVAQPMAFVEAPPAPVIEVPATITPDKIAHTALSHQSTLATAVPVAVKMAAVTLPSPPVIEVPVTLPTEKITHTIPARHISFAAPSPTIKKLSAVTLPDAPVIEVPVTLAPEKITHANPAQRLSFATTGTSTKKMKTVEPGILPPLIIDTPATPKNVDKIARLQPAHLRPTNIIFVIEDKAFVTRRVPELPPLKFEPVKTPVSKPTIAVTPPAPTTIGKRAEYTIQTEDAKETSIEVYLTNGKGKYFTSTPQMQVMDPGTDKVIKTFYRTVDPDGNPDPQTNIPVGTYNIALSQRRSLVVTNVKVEQGKKTKVIVKVEPCSLSFQYVNAPNRPVTEFYSRVTERNKNQGRVQDQKCTDKLEYDPGNYHIMINTFPQTDRNVDLDFDEAVITILQPGFAKFSSDGKIATAVLYKQEGDKFLPFHTLNLNDAAAQHLRMQPGEYQAHYHKGPTGTGDKAVSFLVKATEEVTVEIK